MFLRLGTREEIYTAGGRQCNPTAGIGYWLPHGWKLKASASRAFRLPRFTHLYCWDPVDQHFLWRRLRRPVIVTSLERINWSVSAIMLFVAMAPLPGFAQGTTTATRSWADSRKFGRVRLIPSGFFEMIGLVRSAETADNVSTDFVSIPLGKSSPDALSSVKHSRLAIRAETALKRYRLTGYVETDFLNSPSRFAWRVRQAFGQVERNGWQILAGQAWSLLRANQKGLSSYENLIDIDVIDPAYHVGLVGGRRRQVRLSRNIGSWTAAVSYEAGRNVIAKVTRDSRLLHWEAAGLSARQGRWGAAVAIVIQPVGRLSFLSQQFVSDGVGGEVVGGGPERVRAYSTIEGLESRLGRGVTLFGYNGIVYSERSTGNRVVREWTVGASKKLFAVPGYGVATLAGHFSHVDRAQWQGAVGEMRYLMVSFRYTVP